MNRRTVLALGVAALAGFAGASGALWRSRGIATGSRRAGEAIWSMGFETPDGPVLQLSTARGKPLLLNFWATWCPPCVSELPLLDRFQSEHRGQGWQVVGLAIDQRDPVVDFLRRQPVAFPIGLAGMEGVELTRQLGNAMGALPFSVVFDSSGSAVLNKVGVIQPTDLQSWVATVA